MSAMASLAAPLIVSLVCIYAMLSGVDVYRAMCMGAKKGLSVLYEMLPALICLFPALWLFRETVLSELFSRLLGPLFESAGIPRETALLVLLRPLSGSAALSEAAAIIESFGPDSLVGRTAAVMIGSSETSFYVIAVYFSAAGINKSRWAIPAALGADLTCFLSSAWICRIMWG